MKYKYNTRENDEEVMRKNDHRNLSKTEKSKFLYGLWTAETLAKYKFP